MARKSRNKVTFGLKDGENYAKHTTGEVFRPEMWEVRKAFYKLAELLPNSPAVDIVTVIKARPFVVDTDIDGIYREQVVPFIMGLYGYLYDHSDEVDTTIVCLMWVVRNAHYHYFGGPVPDQRRKPRRKVVRTDEWKERMVCPLCLKGFTFPKEATNLTYKQALSMFNTWLKVHTKSCQPDARTRKALEEWNAGKNELMSKQTAEVRWTEYTAEQNKISAEATAAELARLASKAKYDVLDRMVYRLGKLAKRQSEFVRDSQLPADQRKGHKSVATDAIRLYKEIRNYAKGQNIHRADFTESDWNELAGYLQIFNLRPELFK